MSRTLFWYIFRDLLKIFILTSIVLAGMMSFGGLLKPMTENGLSASQAGMMLLYFLPATQTYALPVAALFATTMVYGRLAGDNELTACRASGISSLSLVLPAVVMGLSLAIVSLLLFSFVVPRFMLKAENVIFANMAEVVKKRVDKMHQVSMGGFTVFANSADSLIDAEGKPYVALHDVVFVKYENLKAMQRFELPTEYWTASEAQAYIFTPDEKSSDEATEADAGSRQFIAHLTDGVKITRAQGPGAGSAATDFGPLPVESPIREKTQFMDIRKLQYLFAHPEGGKNVKEQLDKLLREEVESSYLHMVQDSLRKQQRFTFAAGDEAWTLVKGEKAPIVKGEELELASREAGRERQVLLQRRHEQDNPTEDRAFRAIVRVKADTGPTGHGPPLMQVEVAMDDVLVDSASGATPRENYHRLFTVPMPPELAQKLKYTYQQYKESAPARPNSPTYKELRHCLDELTCEITTAIHSRASFAVSCLILVIVGCALGMLFRSGDFLTAFAISVIPALMTIALITTGQHVGEGGAKSLSLGIGLIWSGNGIVLLMALYLLRKLHRQ